MVKTILFVCELLFEEAKAALALEELEDVELIPYRSGIGSPEDSIRSLSGLIREANGPEPICVVGSEWISSLNSMPYQSRSAHLIEVGSSYELVAGKTLTDQLLNQGAFMVYPGTLNRWKELLAPFDFKNPQDVECFSGTMNKIVLLDTCAKPVDESMLEEMASTLGLPFERVNVGLDIFRLNISKGVLAARLNKEIESNKLIGKTEARIRADYAMAFDLLQEISQESDEKRVIDSIFNIMDLLFAPEDKEYYPIDYGVHFRPISEGLTNDVLDETGKLRSDIDGFDESIQGFRLKIANKGRVMGIIIVRGMAFPEFWKQYISLGTQMAPVFGLAIANARHFKDLEESERKVERALSLERATLDISKLFIGKVIIEDVMPGSLHRISLATNSDRASLFLVSNGYTELSKVNEWCDERFNSIPSIVRSIPSSEQSWLLNRLNTESSVVIEDIGDQTSEVMQQLAPFKDAGVRSMAMVPVQVDGLVSGFICLQDLKGRRQWEDDHLGMLGFLGQTLTMTMQVRKTQKDVSRENESLIVMHKVLRHDIKNELMVVNGSLELLAINQERKNMDRAMASTAKIQEMLEQFRQLDAFLLSGKGLFPCGIADTIHNVMAGHHMPYRIDGDETVMADLAFVSVIENLVNNSRRHGMAEHLIFEIRSQGPYVELTVSDDGIGIPVEIRDKIFREGFSFGHNKSTGLGLFLIRKTMERYGGLITVEGNQPKGAKFILSFPKSGLSRKPDKD